MERTGCCDGKVHVNHNGEGKNFKMLSCARPHMRAFHLSWFGFFLAFSGWFSIPPLMGSIKKSLNLTKDQINSSNIASVSATVAMRVVIGPLCDKFGSRRVMGLLLMICAIPVGFAGAIQDATGLITIRVFVGLIGGVFVPCQFWTSVMFDKKVVGTSNAIVGGWGNLGGGAAFLLLPAIYNLIGVLGGSEEEQWRYAFVLPAFLCLLTGAVIMCLGDDNPEQYYGLAPTEAELQQGSAYMSKQGQSSFIATETSNYLMSSKSLNMTKPKSKWLVIKSVVLDYNVWVLMLQYAACFGVELQFNNFISLYLQEEFSLSQTDAGLIAFLFGGMNLFARALGGISSDKFYAWRGVPGRIVVHAVLLFCEGALVLAFSYTESLGLAIVLIMATSVFTQATEGTTFGMVPHVNAEATGAVAGFVGAGGNIGAVIWGNVFKFICPEDDKSCSSERQGMRVIAISAMVAAFLGLVLLRIGGAHSSKVCSKPAAAADSEKATSQALSDAKPKGPSKKYTCTAKSWNGRDAPNSDTSKVVKKYKTDDVIVAVEHLADDWVKVDDGTFLRLRDAKKVYWVEVPADDAAGEEEEDEEREIGSGSEEAPSEEAGSSQGEESS